MVKMTLAAMFIAITTLPSAAQAPPSSLGTQLSAGLSGPLEIPADPPFTVTIRASAGAIIITYPQLGCVGELQVESENGDQMVLAERLISGQTLCGSGGWITLTRGAEGSVAFAMARSRGGEVELTAMLTALPPESNAPISSPLFLAPPVAAMDVAQPAPKSNPPSRPVISQPAETPTLGIATLTGRDLVREVQAGLERVGCDPRGVDGSWGRNSQAALDRYGRQKGLVFTGPDMQVLAQLAAGSALVCPPECSRREIEMNGKCVTRTCPSGQVLSGSGNCVVQSRKCYFFDGKRICN